MYLFPGPNWAHHLSEGNPPPPPPNTVSPKHLRVHVSWPGRNASMASKKKNGTRSAFKGVS